jgi:2-keto-4-pentenoate hydratase/2-oxohepta-3-ene-1,7-dioic acid hydratase in catechol pathway
MRFARANAEEGPTDVFWHDHAWHGIASMFDPVPRPTGRVYGEAVQLLAPTIPRVMIGALRAFGERTGASPVAAFLKSPRTIIGPGEAIPVDTAQGAIVGEAEVAIVIRVAAQNVSPDRARDVILGWTLANDLTAVDLLEGDPTLFKAKGGAGFTPLGPWIETDIVEVDLTLASAPGPDARGSTTALRHDPFELVAELSALTPLGPGDVILTGAPNTSRALGVGPVTVIARSRVGTMELVNSVVERQRPSPRDRVTT